MQPPPVPLDESRRLAALRALAMIDTPAEERFDRLTRLAARLFGASAATISLVDDSREWVKSNVGFLHEQIARRVSIAAHAIGTGELLVVDDLAADHRFSDHPLVTGSSRYRFYAGQPLHSIDGSQPAVLSIYGEEPRALSVSDRNGLSDLAAVIERELRDAGLSAPQLAGAGRGEASRVDPLTRLWNRTAMFEIVRRELDEARATNDSVAMLIIELPSTRDALMPDGQPVDDWALVETARVLRASLRPYDVIARFAGLEFAALLTGVGAANAADAAARIRGTIARDLQAGSGHMIPVTIGATTSAAMVAEPESLIRAAQSALWSAKSQGGSTVHFVQSTPVANR
jgi:diguanylate cyclase (GGDEF)-like protein